MIWDFYYLFYYCFISHANVNCANYVRCVQCKHFSLLSRWLEPNYLQVKNKIDSYQNVWTKLTMIQKM